jgi:hypothetical protein
MADGIGILTALHEQDRMETLANTTIISLVEAAPPVLVLRTAQGKLLLAPGNSQERGSAAAYQTQAMPAKRSSSVSEYSNWLLLRAAPYWVVWRPSMSNL